MSNELIAASAQDVAALLDNAEGSKYATKVAEERVMKVGDYLPYIQLFGGNSIEVKRGDFPIGHFGLVINKKIVDLGKEIVLFLVSWRPKAMQFRPSVLSFYDTLSEQFREIEATADQKNSGKAFGPEFLITLPLVDSNRFCTYFMGNKTGRNESPNLMALLKPSSDGTPAKRVCLQRAKLIENTEYSWHGPETKDYDIEVPLPDLTELKKQVEKFNNPPASVAEVAETAEAASDRD